MVDEGLEGMSSLLVLNQLAEAGLNCLQDSHTLLRIANAEQLLYHVVTVFMHYQFNDLRLHMLDYQSNLILSTLR